MKPVSAGFAVIPLRRSVHLTGDAETLDICAVHTAFRDNGAERFNGGIPPIERFLFRPAVFFLIHRIFNCLGGNYIAVHIKKNGFGTAGTKVYTDQIVHRDLSFLCCKKIPQHFKSIY